MEEWRLDAITEREHERMTRRPDPAKEDGWEEHRRAQLDGFLQATPAQRLHWLEQAIVFAHRTGALPRHDGASDRPGDALDEEREP